MLDALASSLEGGLSLDKAIAAQGRRLPAHLAGLVKAGERTGRTGEILGRFAGYVQVGVDVRRQLWLNLSYPIIATILAVALLLFVLRYIVGGFDEIFRDFGIPLPTLSWFLLSIANALWGQQGFKFLPDFLDLLATNYAGGIRLVDFARGAESARLAINAWVSVIRG